MDLRASLPVRCLRALLLAAVMVAAGAVAHVSADGRLPGGAAMLTLYVVTAAGCAAVLGRQASAPRLVGLMVGGQLVVHGVLSDLSGHAAMPMTPHGPQGGMVHPVASTSLAPEWVAHGADDMLAHPVMAAAHVLAAAAVGLWLAVGEHALWALVRLARCSARGALTGAVAALALHPVVLRGVPRLVGVRAVEMDPLPLLPIWSRGPARRGPPRLLLPH